MSIIDKLTENNYIYAPADGEVIPLGDVQDEVFSKGMMGNGIAIKITDDTIYSPCNGKIGYLPESKHAFFAIDKKGIQILVHVGLETVNLNGQGFTALKVTGDSVKKGEPILKLDLDYFRDKKIDLTTMVIITETNYYDIRFESVSGVKVGEKIAEIKK